MASSGNQHCAGCIGARSCRMQKTSKRLKNVNENVRHKMTQRTHLYVITKRDSKERRKMQPSTEHTNKTSLDYIEIIVANQCPRSSFSANLSRRISHSPLLLCTACSLRLLYCNYFTRLHCSYALNLCRRPCCTTANAIV